MKGDTMKKFIKSIIFSALAVSMLTVSAKAEWIKTNDNWTYIHNGTYIENGWKRCARGASHTN